MSDSIEPATNQLGYPDLPEPLFPYRNLVRYEAECFAPAAVVRDTFNIAFWKFERSMDTNESEWVKEVYRLDQAYFHRVELGVEDDAREEIAAQVKPVSDSICFFKAWAHGPTSHKVIAFLAEAIRPFENRAGQVRRLRSQGLTQKEIAARLNISLATVKRDLK